MIRISGATMGFLGGQRPPIAGGGQVLTRTQDNEELIQRVAALDIGKAELMCCVRVPGEDHHGKRLQEVQAYPTMTRSLLGMSDSDRCDNQPAFPHPGTFQASGPPRPPTRGPSAVLYASRHPVLNVLRPDTARRAL